MLTWIPTLTSRKLPIRQATKHGAWAWPNACKAASPLRLTIESSVVHFPLVSKYPDPDPWPSFLSPATHMAHYGAARAQTKSPHPWQNSAHTTKKVSISSLSGRHRSPIPPVQVTGSSAGSCSGPGGTESAGHSVSLIFSLDAKPQDSLDPFRRIEGI